MLSAIFLVFPLVIYNYELTGVALSDLICLAGIYYFAKNIFTARALVLLLAIMLGLVSAVIGIFLYEVVPLVAIGSMLFLFKPCFAYFVGLSLINSRDERELFFHVFSWSVVLLVVAIVLSLLLNHNMVVRSESVLNGSFFGLPLFGSYGVNSLAAFYLMLAFGLMFHVSYIKVSTRLSVLFLFVAVILFVLIFLSMSRMAILGAICLLVGIVWHLFLKHPLRGVGAGVLGLCLLGVVLYWTYQTGILDSKLDQIARGLQSGDMNYLSSGRLDLYSAAIEQIFNAPFWGVAFGGYETTLTAIQGYDYLSALSPHNQYITLFWKMGFPAAVCYLFFLGMVVSSSLRQNKAARGWVMVLTSIVLVVFCNLWDVLLVPNVAAFFYFFLGGLGRGRQES